MRTLNLNWYLILTLVIGIALLAYGFVKDDAGTITMGIVITALSVTVYSNVKKDK